MATSLSLSLYQTHTVCLSLSIYIIYIKKFISYIYIHTHTLIFGASQVELVVKNPPANTGDIREVGSVSGLGGSPGKEKPGRLLFIGLHSQTLLKQLRMHAYIL